MPEPATETSTPRTPRRASRALTAAVWVLLIGSAGLFGWALSNRGGEPKAPPAETMPPVGTVRHIEWRIEQDARALKYTNSLREGENRAVYLASVEATLQQIGTTLDLADELRFDDEGNPTLREPRLTELTAPLRTWMNDLSRQTTFGSLTEEQGAATFRPGENRTAPPAPRGGEHREDSNR